MLVQKNLTSFSIEKNCFENCFTSSWLNYPKTQIFFMFISNSQQKFTIKSALKLLSSCSNNLRVKSCKKSAYKSREAKWKTHYIHYFWGRAKVPSNLRKWDSVIFLLYNNEKFASKEKKLFETCLEGIENWMFTFCLVFTTLFRQLFYLDLCDYPGT